MDNFKITSKVMIKSNDRKGSYGPGVDRLIREVDKTGSLNQATKNMDMSYSKAWKLVNKTEEMLGFDLIERHSGAKGSELTKEGKELLAFYDDLEIACKEAIDKVKEKYDSLG